MKMKKLFLSLSLILILCLSGCATSKITTTIGSNIGESFAEAAAIGTVNAEITIKAWPYIYGMIHRAQEHGLELTMNVDKTIKNLNRIAKKDFKDITLEEKGDIILSVCIVEVAALRSSWDRYGVSIMRVISTF